MDVDFSSLEFKNISDGVEQASVKLPNGYTVNIRKGNKVAHTYGAPYEISMSPEHKETMEDSVGYLTEKEVKQLINEISSLAKVRNK